MIAETESKSLSSPKVGNITANKLSSKVKVTPKQIKYVYISLFDLQKKTIEVFKTSTRLATVESIKGNSSNLFPSK